MNDVEFLKSFEDCTLPFAEWHHRAHIKVAYLYLRQYSFETAVEQVRSRIKALNTAHKVPEGPDRGYHETMTQAWVRLVHLTLCEYGPGETADEFFEQHPQLSQKKVLRFFYSRERFMSPLAKVEFLEPDLAPLPKSVRQNG